MSRECLEYLEYRKVLSDGPEESLSKPRLLVVPLDRAHFPNGRRCSLCGEKVRAGESVLTFPVRKSGQFTTFCVLHRRCMESLIGLMEYDDTDPRHPSVALQVEEIKLKYEGR